MIAVDVNGDRSWPQFINDASIHLTHAIGCLKQASYRAPTRHSVIFDRLIRGLAGARRLLAATAKETASQ